MNSTTTRGTFDDVARRGADLLLEVLFPLLERLTWDRATLERHRAAELAATLAFAREHSSWHAERLDAVDLDAVAPDDLSELPTMGKAELMENWDEIVTDPRLNLADARAHLRSLDVDGPSFFHDEYLVFTTGGTTGAPGVFPWSLEEMARWAASAIRVGTAAGLGPPARLCHVGARSFRHPSASAPLLLYGAEAGSELVVPVDQPVEAIVAELNRVQPDALWVVCSMLPALSSAAAEGALRIDVDRISVGGDQLASGALDEAESAFGVRPTETYPTTDAGYLAQQVPGETSLMINEDLLVVEAVDENDRQVAMGDVAHHLLVSSLHQRTLPLIRYRIDDRVRLDPTPGQYPAYTRIAEIHGRSDDAFHYDGVTVHPHVFRSAISEQPAVRDYEVRQTEHGALVQVVVDTPDGGIGNDLGGLLRARLVTAGLDDPVVDVEVVPDLERTAVGKRRLFIRSE